MKIIDISVDPFTTPPYPGDPDPRFRWLSRVEQGAEYSLSIFGMTPHAGTHVDAPLHYLRGGAAADDIPLENCYGACTVVTLEGILTGEDMDKLLPHCRKRLIIRGNGKASLELSAARVIADYKMLLIGIDAQSVAFDAQEGDVHRELLRGGVVILENLDLTDAPDGEYVLSALPLKLGSMEAAPTRAVLITK